MRYLIDTQILLWIFSEPAKLPSDVAQTIKRPKNELLIISQAIVESLPIISSDDKFSDYEINRMWK